MSVSAARSRVMHAQMNMDSRRYDEVESKLQEALEFLVGLPEEETAELAAEIAALRTAAAKEAAAEKYGALIRTAERELRAGENDLERGYQPSDVEYRADKAEGYVAEVPDEFKGQLVAQIAAFRARVAGETPAPVAEESAPAQPAGPSEADTRILSRLRSELVGIRSYVERRQSEGVDEALDELAGKLAAVSDPAVAAPMLAEVDELRAEAAAVGVAEAIRNVTSELDRNFSFAEIEDASDEEMARTQLAKLGRRMEDEDVRRVLPAEVLERYQTRLADARANLDALLKADMLDRTLYLVNEIEERLATDPYVGLSQDEGFVVTDEMRYKRDRVLTVLMRFPEDDADVLEIKARLAAADERMNAALGVIGTAKLEADVAERWAMRRSDFADWEQEVAAPVERAGDVPALPQTHLAVARIGYLLEDGDLQQTKAEHADNAAVQAVYREIDETFAAAGAKLYAAYTAVLDHADGLPAPEVEADVDRLSHLETATGSSFERTEYREALLGRISQIKARWQGEYDALLQARQELWDRLAEQATAAWPAIVAATGATEDFDPNDADAVGRTVLLSGVRNRAGWDFSGFDFCRRVDGVPVGGPYEPHVLKALEHAWYELKLDVSDRLDWDVIGVVTGPTKVGERTQRILKDTNNREIGKIEEWPPIDCVGLRIIALHAGPVAVGPS
jgi:hypothetical protein